MMKDYVSLAAAINKNYPTMYDAKANVVGIVVHPKKPCSLPHAANFLQGCFLLKGTSYVVSPIVESFVLCIQ